MKRLVRAAPLLVSVFAIAFVIPARTQEKGFTLSRIGSGGTGGSIASLLLSNWVVPGKRRPG